MKNVLDEEKKTSEKCDHIIGFCQAIDKLIWKSDCERDPEMHKKYLSSECSYFVYSDTVFNYCPDCGVKLNG